MTTNEFIIYSDLHIGSPYEMNPFNFNGDFDKKIKFSKNTVFLGDNFDFFDSLKTELEKIKILREQILKKVVEAGGIFIDGNHELFPIDGNNFYAIRDGILFIHGNIIDYGFEGAKKWIKRRNPGRTRLFWGLLKMYREIISGEHKKIGQKYIERAIKTANEFNCHTIIFGHFHMKSLTIIKKDNKTIIVVPKGITKINL